MPSEMPSWRLELSSQSVKTMLDMTGWRYSRPTSLSAASRETYSVDSEMTTRGQPAALISGDRRPLVSPG